jgi:hypothetical protein
MLARNLYQIEPTVLREAAWAQLMEATARNRYLSYLLKQQESEASGSLTTASHHVGEAEAEAVLQIAPVLQPGSS